MTHVPCSNVLARLSWAPSPPAPALSFLGLILTLSLGGCTGIFQWPLPDKPARYAFQARGELRIGSAEADITPKGVQYLAGFGVGRKSTGIHSRLKVRAMVLTIGGEQFAIVGIDNMGLERQDVDWIKRGLVGFANGNVLLCSSHTHAAPDLVGLWGWWGLTSGRDPNYLALVRQGVEQAVTEALRKARPARLYRGEARVPKGLFQNRNRREVYNRRLTALVARDLENNQILGTLLHAVCHPEMMRRHHSLVSADFVGELCDRWKAADLGQAVFVNGELGGMVTPTFSPKGPNGIPLMVDKLVEVAKRALADAQPIVVDGIEMRRRDVYLPLRSHAMQIAALTVVIPRPIFEGHIRSTVGYMRIGTFEAALVPGEMEPTLAWRLRRMTRRPDLVIFGLVDDEVGYLLTEEDAWNKKYAYERLISPGWDAGELVYDALLK